jgi:hypothetical protein
VDVRDTVSTSVKGDPVGNRLRLIHSQAHIESYAIDLSWDILLRFAGADVPTEFYLDWLRVANDEAKHFLIWYRVWCGCGVVWCGAVWCSVVWCSVV